MASPSQESHINTAEVQSFFGELGKLTANAYPWAFSKS